MRLILPLSVTICFFTLLRAAAAVSGHDDGPSSEPHEILRRALLAAQDIDSEERRIVAIAETAAALARAGFLEEAEEAFAAATSETSKIPDERDRARTLLEIAKQRNLAGQRAQSLELIQTIPNNYCRMLALNDLAVAEAQANDHAAAHVRLTEAIDIAEAEDWLIQPVAFTNVAIAYIRIGDQVGALKIARRIENRSTRDSVLGILAQLQVQNGRLAAATRLITKIKDESKRGPSMQSIANAQARSGQWSDGLATARRTADPVCRIRSLAAIARLDAKPNDLDSAAIIDEAMSVADQVEGDAEKVTALAILAAAHAHLGRPEKARELIAKARTLSPQIEDPFDRFTALNRVAKALCVLGDTAGALELAQEQSNARDRDSVLAASVRMLAERGLIEDARRFSDCIEDKTWKWDANAAIARRLIAERDWKGATEMAQATTYRIGRARIFYEVALGASRAQKVREVVAIAELEGDPYAKFRALHGAAVGLLESRGIMFLDHPKPIDELDFH